MALLWVDGFEGYETTDEHYIADRLIRRGYTHPGGPGVRYSVRDGRFGGKSLWLFGDGGPWVRTPALTTDRTLIAGVSIYMEATDTYPGANPIITFFDGDNNEGMMVYLNGDPGRGTKFQIARGWSGAAPAAILETVDDPLFPMPLQWYHLEFKVYCDNTAGTYELKLNGVTIASDTGVDTQEGTSNYHQSVRLHSINDRTPHYDDLYVCDGTGSKNNDFLGVVKAVPIFPESDHTAQWETVVGGPNHADSVDEIEPDDDTTYIEDDDVGDKDIFEYADITDSLVSIDGLMLHTICRETDATTFDIIQIIRSGGTEYDQASQAVGSSSYVNRYDILESDPDTALDWTKTGINAAQFGVKVD
jgi:hypothetical protein